MDTFREYLTRITWSAANGATVRVVGFEPEVLKIPRLLGIQGEPADPLVIALEHL